MYEILHLQNRIDITKSAGPDGISAKVLNISRKIITSFLTDNCNKVLKYGVYPRVLKVAKVIPIYKSGKKTDSSNYRPISVLSHLNKIVEQVIHKRLIDFFDKYSILTENQFGFRKSFQQI